MYHWQTWYKEALRLACAGGLCIPSNRAPGASRRVEASTATLLGRSAAADGD